MTRLIFFPKKTSFTFWVLMFVTMVHSNSFAGPLYVMIMPNEEKASRSVEKKSVKVCLVVKDSRPASVVKTQMCGLTRNGFGKEMGMIALRNVEPLETILAHDVADRLRYAGYEVVRVIPNPPATLSTEYRPKMKGMKSDIKAARKTQTKTERKEARAIRDARSPESAAPVKFVRRAGSIESEGKKGWTNGADVVVEIEITKFTSDVLIHTWTIEILGWSTATIKMAPAEDKANGTLAFAEIGGLGQYQAPAAGKGSFKSAINKSYRFLLDDVEKAFMSDENLAILKD